MKRAMIAGLGVVALMVGVEAANAQANINPSVYPNRPGAQESAGWEWYATPGPKKRGNMCVTDVDSTRGYGVQKPCPAPQASAAPAQSRTSQVTQGRTAVTR